eukprot:UN21314
MSLAWLSEKGNKIGDRIEPEENVITYYKLDNLSGVGIINTSCYLPYVEELLEIPEGRDIRMGYEITSC